MHTYRVCNLWSHGDKSMRSIHIHVYVYTHSTCEIVCTLDYIYNLYVRARAYVYMHDGSMYWQSVWECVRARTRTCMYVCGGCRRILLYWSRVVDHLPFSSATLPHLSPPHTVPRPCTPCSPRLFLCASSSCSTRRHPSENLRLSDNLQSHVFSCVSAPMMIYDDLSQICIRVIYPLCTRGFGFLYECLFLIAAIEFLVSSANRSLRLKWIMHFTWYPENELFVVKRTRSDSSIMQIINRIDISSEYTWKRGIF